MATSPEQILAPRALRGILTRPGEAALALVAGVGLLLIALRMVDPYPPLAPFSGEALTRLPDVLAPLVVLSLFLERAVEVIMTAWRAERTHELKVGVQVETRRCEAGSPRASLAAARRRLAAYQAESQRLAFFTGLVLALVVSMMGVRAVEMLVEPEAVRQFPAGQRGLFVWTDVLLTALLLTGGAEGIHRMVETFTDFLEATQRKLAPAGADAASATSSSVDEAGAMQAESEDAPAAGARG